MFDSAETILGALIFSTFFPLYITKHIDTKVYSLVYGFSFLVSFFLALYFGKIADRRALRKHFFIFFVLLTTLFGVFIYFTYILPFLALFLYSLMAISHQQSMIFYNSLLASFEKKGFISGFGVALGYIGSASALLFLINILEIPSVFLVVPLIFLLISLPSLIVLENPRHKSIANLRSIFSDKSFLLFMISLLCLTEVANTLIAMMSIYLKKVYLLDDTDIYKTIGFSALGGVIGGIFWGKVVDKYNSKRIFPIGFFLWLAFLISLYFVPRELLIGIGFLGGFSLAHLWTVSRVYLIENFSKGEVSVRMSFLSLTERISSSIGLFIWSFLLLVTNNNYKLSALLMATFPIIGFFVWLYKPKNYTSSFTSL